MPSRRTSGLMIGFVVLALLAAAAVAIGLPALQPDFAQGDIERAVLAEANAQNLQESAGQPTGETTVSDVRVEGAWAFGFLVTRAPDPSLQIHAEPDLRLFITRRDEASGEVTAALEYTPEFYARLDQVPPGLIPQDGLDMLRDVAAVARGEASVGGLNFALPWQSGQTWTMTGGPHPDSGIGSARPWSAIDLAYGPAVGIVRAAESGVVWRSSDCPNFIRIDHSGGYRTGYYHVTNEQVINGQSVLRGDALASEGIGTGCGGYVTGAHVHFSLRYYDTRINIAGNEFAGWLLQDGGSPYNGCMLRLRDNLNMCTPRAQIEYEDGVLPVISDVRYDYNRDGRPDLWVVNLRPTDGGTAIIEIFDGSNFNNTISLPRTSLPPQPVALNTAFAAGDYNRDGTPDIWLFHRRMDTSNTTALRIIDGANPQFLLLDTPTALPPLGDDARFAVAEFNRNGTYDIYAIVPNRTANNVRVMVVDSGNPLVMLDDRTATMPAPAQFSDVVFAVADYDANGRADLWAITPRDPATNSVSVRILTGNGFQTPLAISSTALTLNYLEPDRHGFVVTDYNRDGTPDLWYLDRKTSAMTIISGKNFSTVLYNGTTGARRRDTLSYQVVGSDRARLTIPPQASRLLSPPDGTVIVDPSVTLRFEPSAMSKKMTVNVRDALGNPLKSSAIPKNITTGCPNNICVFDTGAAGLVLQDGQSLFWSVTAKNAYGVTVSAIRSIRVDLPGPVSVLSPLANQEYTSQSQLTWTPRPTATAYKLKIKNLTAGGKTKHNVSAASCAAACVFDLPLANGNYWVMVMSLDGQGGSSQTAKIRFSVNVPPPTATPDGTLTLLPSATITPTMTSTLNILPTATLTPTRTPTVNPNATLPLPPTIAGFRAP